MICKIGGSHEEATAQPIEQHILKPVFALIAGKNALPNRSMGHAAQSSRRMARGVRTAKIEELSGFGVHICETTAAIEERIGTISI